MSRHLISRTGIAALLGLHTLWGAADTGWAQTTSFAPGWTLQPDASSLRFQSVKNEVTVESSQFATYTGQIGADGVAKVTIKLDSVDTKIDLRNVRMRFLFFETFQFPEATITATLDPSAFSDITTVRRKTITLPYTLDLHGVSKSFEAEVVVTLLSDDLVAVSTGAPIVVAAADFNLMPGVEKLEEAANVTIIPSATVSFDFMFARNGSGPARETEAPIPTQVALEPEGDLDATACVGRFEIVSRTGSVYFPSGSAQMDDKSKALLDSLSDIVVRCPGMKIEISGHTDSDGPDDANLRLSERRAVAVLEYLQGKGIDGSRFTVVGRGESQPLLPNTSAKNKWKNRRIEFTVIDG